MRIGIIYSISNLVRFWGKCTPLSFPWGLMLSILGASWGKSVPFLREDSGISISKY